MKPTVGEIVNYFPGDTPNMPVHNGAEMLPAVIVRVWSDTCVNLKVFNDGDLDFWKTSVLLDEDIDKPTQSNTWRWPVRLP